MSGTNAPPDVADLVRRLREESSITREENRASLTHWHPCATFNEPLSGDDEDCLCMTCRWAKPDHLMWEAADALDAHSVKENARPHGARETDSGGRSPSLAPTVGQQSAITIYLPFTSEQLGAIRALLFILISNCHQHESRSGPIAADFVGVQKTQLYDLLNKLPSPPSETP